MISFKLPHELSWPDDIMNEFDRTFGSIALCPFSGCTTYVALDADLREWLDRTGIMYLTSEPMPGYPFEISFQHDSDAALFKLTWL